MSAIIDVQVSNTILYCRHWQQTVSFYRDGFLFPVTYANDWFVELQLAGGACLSVADESRASIRSARGHGITLAWRTQNLHTARERLLRAGLAPGPIRAHAWGAWVCCLRDPEGHRVELWTPR